jgi:monofunctional biosynthetic peptidoglycan transglycosylase
MIAIRFDLTCLLAASVCFWLAPAVRADSASAKTLFDFAGPTNAPTWQVVNDDVMGGISTSTFEVTNGVASFRGELSLAHNGGFASVRSLPARLDLADGDAFLLRVRGDGRRYQFTARGDRSFDSLIYQAPFPTKPGEWAELRLPIKDLVPTFRGRVLAGEPPLDPTRVTSVGFLISDQQAGQFQLDVAWIKVASRAGG